MAEGTMKIVRKKSFFQNPSLERQLKREEAQRQRKKDEIKLLRKIESEESDWRG
jgi:ribosomal protein S21